MQSQTLSLLHLCPPMPALLVRLLGLPVLVPLVLRVGLQLGLVPLVLRAGLRSRPGCVLQNTAAF